MTTKPYYVLFVKEDNLWTIEFGDYGRSVVKVEQEDLHDGYKSIPYKNMKIVKCADALQDTITYQCSILNKYSDKVQS